MDTHYHIWLYRRAEDGTIRSMERDDVVYPTRRRANYALSDGRMYWNAGQVLQCVDGAFCQPMPEEMVDRGMPFGSKYVGIEQLADQARSIRPAAKRAKAMEQREELDAAGRIKSLEAVKAELGESQAEVDAEIAQLVAQLHTGETEAQGRDPGRWFPPATGEPPDRQEKLPSSRGDSDKSCPY